MGDRFEFKAEPLPRVLRRGAPSRIFQKVVNKPIDQMANVLQVNLEKASPVGATGTLRRTWGRTRQKIVNPQVATITMTAAGRQAVKANVWDTGSKTHFPPETPIRFWVTRKLGDGAFYRPRVGEDRPLRTANDLKRAVFRIRKTISERGLPNPEHPEGFKVGTFTRAFNRSLPAIGRIARVFQAALVAELNRAS